jgi:hypothetical protein
VVGGPERERDPEEVRQLSALEMQECLDKYVDLAAEYMSEAAIAVAVPRPSVPAYH